MSPNPVKPPSTGASRVEEATINSSRSGTAAKPMSPKPKKGTTTPVTDRNDNIPTDHDQHQATTPVKPSTP